MRENCIARAFAYRLLRRFFAGCWTWAGILAFHTSHRCVLLAHSATDYQLLRRLVARGKAMPRAKLRARYEALFMATLLRPVPIHRHAKVLKQMVCQLGQALDAPLRGMNAWT